MLAHSVIVIYISERGSLRVNQRGVWEACLKLEWREVRVEISFTTFCSNSNNLQTRTVSNRGSLVIWFPKFINPCFSQEKKREADNIEEVPEFFTLVHKMRERGFNCYLAVSAPCNPVLPGRTTWSRKGIDGICILLFRVTHVQPHMRIKREPLISPW